MMFHTSHLRAAYDRRVPRLPRIASRFPQDGKINMNKSDPIICPILYPPIVKCYLLLESRCFHGCKIGIAKFKLKRGGTKGKLGDINESLP